MSKNNNDFFKSKKDWSKIKDKLLAAYLEPYLQKILMTQKPVLYLDCFAGKGKFEDGEPGSPIIALNIKNDVLARAKSNKTIGMGFIDANHSEELKKNIASFFPNQKIPVVSGKYEEDINKYLQNRTGCNIFLYIDPYGIKALDYNLFAGFADSDFNSIELLINMNTFGFLRAGCAALKAKDMTEDFSDELVEYEPTQATADADSIKLLNSIAGGEYWKQIIEDYNLNKINMYDAEKRFSDLYRRKLQEKYKYVLDMPLRLKAGGRALYRLVHASNHEDACILMADSMMKRAKELMDDVQKAPSLFETDVNNQIIFPNDIKEKFYEFLNTFQLEESVDVVIAKFFAEYGVCCSSGDIKKNILSPLEDNKKIIVTREPKVTATGKPSKTFTGSSKQKVKIRRV